MADLLESFLKEQKAKVANEKVILDQDPPYMEIRALNGDEYKASRKENIPPSMRLNPQAQQANPGKGDSFGLGLPLGEDYERKKRQLQQELRMDYRRYVAQEASRQRKKKKDLNMLQPDQHLDLSLPIGERRSAKDGDADRPSAPGSFRLAEAASGPQQQHPSRRDAATLTEAERRPPREEHHSETDFSEDEWEHAVAARRHRARHVATRARWHRTPDRDGAEGVDDNLETRPARRRRSRIRTQGRRRPQPPHVPEESDSEANQEMPPVVPRHVNPQMCVSVGTRTATSKEQEELAMGLPIGGTEGEMTRQQKKAQYRQDLLEQIAEQQRNRKREKELELRVAATGAVDPEKQPDRIKHFGAGNYNPDTPGSDLVALEKSAIGRPAQEKAPLETKERAPPARPRIAFQSPLLDYSAALGALAGSGAAAGTTGAGLGSLAQLEDFHRTVSSRLGEITAPQFVGVPPPAPPKVDEAYRTPFDDAYFYYGAMDPLELGSALGGPAGGGAHPVSFLAPGPLRGQPSQAQ